MTSLTIYVEDMRDANNTWTVSTLDEHGRGPYATSEYETLGPAMKHARALRREARESGYDVTLLVEGDEV